MVCGLWFCSSTSIVCVGDSCVFPSVGAWRGSAAQHDDWQLFFELGWWSPRGGISNHPDLPCCKENNKQKPGSHMSTAWVSRGAGHLCWAASRSSGQAGGQGGPENLAVRAIRDGHAFTQVLSKEHQPQDTPHAEAHPASHWVLCWRHLTRHNT